jgi:hypothetical protein
MLTNRGNTMTKKMIAPAFVLTAALAVLNLSGCTTAPDGAMPNAGYQLDAAQSSLNFVTTSLAWLQLLSRNLSSDSQAA